MPAGKHTPADDNASDHDQQGPYQPHDPDDHVTCLSTEAPGLLGRGREA